MKERMKQETTQIKTKLRSEVRHIYIAGNMTSAFSIPIEMARKHGMDKKGVQVLVEDTDKGILIRRINLEDLP